MIAHISIRTGIILLSIGAFLVLVELSLAGYGKETLVVITIFGGFQLAAYIWLGIEDTVNNREKGRHVKCQSETSK